MSIKLTPLDKSDFYQKLRALIGRLEGEESKPYLDTEKLATIGIGFNLKSTAIRDDVFKEMGLNPLQIDAAIEALDQDYATNADLKNALNIAIGGVFELTSTQITTLFEKFTSEAIEQVRLKLGIADNTFSQELLALVSLYHNAPGLIGNGLKAAFAMEDPYQARAEAWYQIRYEHADQLHKRRYIEAEVFGLYSTPTGPASIEEAMGVYRWYAARGKGSITPDSNGMANYDARYHSVFAGANADLTDAGFTNYTVQALEEELRPAANLILSKYPDAPANISPLDIWTAESNVNYIFANTNNNSLIIGHATEGSRLFGKDGNDGLYGGAGDDVLDGGLGADILSGGTGFDIYRAANGDQIVDTDGSGAVLLDNIQLGHAFHVSTNVWKDNFGNVLELADGNLIIKKPGSGSTLVIKGFAKGNLGIILHDPEDPNDTQGGKDAAEAVKKGMQGADNRIPRDPFVLDLDGDGIELVGLANSSAYFDLDGDGFATKTSWLKGDDGFLALDRNGDGTINNIYELFGNPEQTGYEVLKELDTNNDGVIDNKDNKFSALKVWQDINGDGISQAGELRSLTEVGIANISLNYQDVTGQTGADFQIARQGAFTWANGTQGLAAETTGIAADVLLGSDPTFTRFVGEVTINPEVLVVSNIKGYGQMPDLHQAMSLNNNLKNYVLNLFTNPTIQSIQENFENLLIQWAGVEDITIGEIDPAHQLNATNGVVTFNAAGESFTLQQLGIIKNYVGVDVLRLNDGQWRENGKLVTTGDYYRQGYNALLQNIFVKFLVANGLTAEVMPKLTYNSISDTLNYSDTVSEYTINRILNSYFSDKKLSEQELFSLFALTKVEPIISENLKNRLAECFKFVEISAGVIELTNKLFELNLKVGSSESDMLTGSVLYGLDGDDTLYEISHGFEGSYGYVATASDDKFYGGAGNDKVIAGFGNNILDGGDGDDVLELKNFWGSDSWIHNGYASSRNTFIGGKGDDNFKSIQFSNDTYIFDRGDGKDVIDDLGGSDRILFGEGITQKHITLEHTSEHNIVISLLDDAGEPTGDSITIKSAYAPFHNIELLEFSDGSKLDGDAILKTTLVVNGTTENDTLAGTDYSETLNGFDGDDMLDAGTYGNDKLYGGTGNDTLTARYGNNILDGGEGDDVLQLSEPLAYHGDYRSSQNTFIGGKGADKLTSVDSSNDTYIFNRGDGKDVIKDWGGTDKIQFGEGISQRQITIKHTPENHLVISLLNDEGELTGDSITIELAWGLTIHGIESLEFSDGSKMDQDAIFKAALIVNGTTGNDTLTGTDYSETLNGFDGDDILDGGRNGYYSVSGHDKLYGGAGNDTLSAHYGNNILNGGEGDDVLQLMDTGKYLAYTFSRNTFIGGKGADKFKSVNSSNDTFIFNRGDGQDVINDWGGTDRILFGEGISQEHITLERTPENHIVISLLDDAGEPTGDSITLEFAWEISGFKNYSIESLEFADGSKMDMDFDAISQIPLVLKGTASNDTLVGTDFVDTIYGFDGDDTIDGGFRDDKLYGGAGNDKLTANSGNSLLDGGDGNDLLSAGWPYYSVGKTNTMIGGRGNDRLLGGESNENYLFGRGDGQDVIKDMGGINTIVFGEGISYKHIVFKITEDNNFLINLLDDKGDSTGDSITIEPITDPSGKSSHGIKSLVFADGSKIPMFENVYFDATNGDDSIIIHDGGDIFIESLGGNDHILISGSGGSLVRGGDGNDYINVIIGDNFLEGDAGDDMIFGGSGNDYIRGGDGDDHILTLDGDTIVEGGTGNDRIDDGSGISTLLFGRGDGIDTIFKYNQADAGELNTIQFKSGIDSSDILFFRLDRDLILSIAGTVDQVVLSGYFSTAQFQSYSVGAMQLVNFSDGTTWDINTIEEKIFTSNGTTNADTIKGGVRSDVLDGFDGDDYILGDAGNDIINGGTGNDYVIGGLGDDILQGGEGDDTLEGGRGNDTYIFSKGDGNKTIVNNDSDIERNDVLRFLEGILPQDVSMVRDGGHLIVTVLTTKEIVTIYDYVYDGSAVLNAIEFADGTVWDEKILNSVMSFGSDMSESLYGNLRDDNIDALGGNDRVWGYSGNDTIFGGAGDDEIYGDEGNDNLLDIEGNNWIYGGEGDDFLRGNGLLEGGQGNDTYLFGKGDGATLIRNYDPDIGRVDVLRFLEGVEVSDVHLARMGDTLVMTIQSSDDTIAVADFFYADIANAHHYGLNAVQFADGTVWSAEQIEALLVSTTDSDDILNGTNLSAMDKSYAVLVDALNAFDTDSDAESEGFIPTRLPSENCHYY